MANVCSQRSNERKEEEEKKNFLSRTKMITTNKRCKIVFKTAIRHMSSFMRPRVCLCMVSAFLVVVLNKCLSAIDVACDIFLFFFFRFCVARRRDRRHIYSYINVISH